MAGARALSVFLRLFATILHAVLAAAVVAAPALAQQGAIENQIKATFLVRFGSFVEWPARALRSAGAPMTICVAGADELVDDVARAAGAAGPGSSVSVRRLDTVGRGSGCNILYAGGGRSQSVASSLRAVAHEPVLTVTDARNGNTRGMIHFLVVNHRVRFHIDQDEAARHGLRLNSRLLNIALTVQGAGGPP